ncbi:hypothetical protein EMMF5_006243 [Cystobasidiomycetes sp. EMM_F5]
MPPWDRLIRFESGSRTLYGQPVFSTSTTASNFHEAARAGRLEAQVLNAPNGIFGPGLEVSSETVKVDKLLCPLDRRDVPSIRCIVLNYKKHILEAGRTLPPYPSVFFKPLTALAGPDVVVEIPKICQDPKQADYEGELCVIVGKTGKNIPIEEAMSYVAGYTCGDDVSSRTWQRDPKFAGSVPQWGFSKGFDNYGVIGPLIVSSKTALQLIPDPAALHMRTIVNGEERQSTSIGDLCFDVRTLVSFLSQGTTLEAGTIIMTGTPGGVGFARKPEPSWLRQGDVVEVEITNIGTLRHSISEEA